MNDQTFGFDAPLSMQLGRVAVLADGENLPFAAVSDFLSLPRHGQIEVIRRAWCNRLNANGWEAAHGFDVSYLNTVAGKNSADIHLVIEAMQIAHDKAVDGFVILSTDRDFAPLAFALRRMGFWVIGVGRAEASQLFKQACTRFYSLARPEATLVTAVASLPSATVENIIPSVQLERPKPTEPELKKAIRHLIETDGATSGYPMAKVDSAVRQKFGFTIASSKFKNWRTYFESHKSDFALDPKGPNARVRVARA